MIQLATAESSEPTIEMIAPMNILFRREALIRDQLYWDTIQTYIDALQRGEELPPPDVFRTGDSEKIFLASGFHRVTAYDHFHELSHMPGRFGDLYNSYFSRENEWGRGRSIHPIKCRVHKGTFEDAVWFAIGSNKTHGRPLTNKEKQHAVRIALRHDNGKELSDRAVASLVGVDNKTVAGIRKELVAAGELPQLEIRMGRDGRKRKVAKTNKGDTIQVRVAFNRHYCCACDCWDVETGLCEGHDRESRPFGTCTSWVPGYPAPPPEWEEVPRRIMASSVKPLPLRKNDTGPHAGRFRYFRLTVKNPALSAVEIREEFGVAFARQLSEALIEILEDEPVGSKPPR